MTSSQPSKISTTILAAAVPINPSEVSRNSSDMLQYLKTGSKLIKHTATGKTNPRQYYLLKSEDIVSCDEPDTLFTKSTNYLINAIDEIRCGYNSSTFKTLLQNKLVHKDNVIELNEEFHSKRFLAAQDVPSWIINHFYSADKDGSGTLTKQECQRLLTDVLNTKMSNSLFQTMFKQADVSGEGLLNQEEFIVFFKTLTRRQDLFTIMQNHVQNGESMTSDTIKMSAQELTNFLLTVERVSHLIEFDIVEDRAIKLIQQFEVDVAFKSQGFLSIDGGYDQ
ncbi:unnamed protein product [Didymodactylos carnosus]|uniref:EF-hand domain-containing protein n=1 Tax=Didymodactylos carnosus TaxID=1234261 RepID=A0A814BWT6_9BILA|nr:unnamed protein product [Didymodactylos carnosus]CAF3712030.1 unnamed protein product [Didymodactylos carnosus]